MCSESSLSYEIIKIVCGGILGGLGGGYFSHHLATIRDSSNDRAARARDRLNRLNHFRGELSRWRCQFHREPDAIAYYKTTADDMAYECGMIESDLVEIAGMSGKLWKLYSFTREEIEPAGQDGKQKLIDHIESLMRELKQVV